MVTPCGNRRLPVEAWVPDAPYGQWFPRDGDRERAVWMLSQVVRKTAVHDVDAYGFVHLHSGPLRRVCGNAVGAIWRRYREMGILDTRPHVAGLRSRGYRLADGVLDRRAVCVELTHRPFIARIWAERDRMAAERETQWLPIHHALRETQYGLSIATEVHAALESLIPAARLCQQVLVGRLEQRRPHFSVSSTGRVFNGLTGLKRTLRPHVRLWGEPMAGLDIRCAQPALLALLLSDIKSEKAATYKRWRNSGRPCLPPGLGGGMGRLTCPDYWRYRDLATSGRLWSLLIESCRASGVALPDDPSEARERAKFLFMRDFLAKRGRYPSPFEDVIGRLFPSVFAAVRATNRANHAATICTLQRVESWLVVEQVAPRLMNDIPIVTLHDAIYGRARDMPIVREAFEQTFSDVAFPLCVKEERKRSSKDRHKEGNSN